MNGTDARRPPVKLMRWFALGVPAVCAALAIAYAVDMETLIGFALGGVIAVGLTVSVVLHRHQLGDSRRREELFRKLFDEAPIGMLLATPDGHLRRVNRAFCDLLGYNEAELLSRTVLELTHPGDRAATHAARARMERGETDRFTLTKRYLHHDGHAVPVQTSVVHVVGKNGDDLRIAQVIDLTERQAAEQRLAERQGELALALEAGGVATWRYDPATQRVTGDARLTRLFELGPRAKSWDVAVLIDRLHPDDRPRLAACIDGALRDGEAYEISFRLKSSSGWREVTSRGVPVVRDGRPVGLIGVSVDLTERQLAALEIDRLRKELQVVLDSVPAFIVHKDTHNNVIRVNRATLEAAGRDRDAVEGHPLADTLPPEDAQRIHEADQQVLETGKPLLGVIQHYRFPGGARWARTDRIPVFGPDGTITGIVVVATDLTDLKVAEEHCRLFASELAQTTTELIEAKRAAERASTAKSAFLATMSHEIRTPLASVLGYTELLRDELADTPHLETVETVLRNGRHLLHLLTDVLDFSRIEAGRFEIEHVSIDPAQLTRDVVVLHQPVATEKNISVMAEVDAELPTAVIADPTRLRQVLCNLVSNAIKFTSVGGVRLEARFERRDGGQLQFAIVDSGIGMTSEQIARVFQPFAQADATINRRFGGTGLGLSISRRIVELMGGRIEVISRPGQGTRFLVTVPATEIRPGVMAEPPPARDTKAIRLDARILVVDDGVDNQRLIRRVLQRAGADVVVANDGEEAVRLASPRGDEPRSFDLILMDVHMPGIDGLAATRLLREAGFSRPILALTADALSETRIHCGEAGCDAVLTKPIERRSLLAAIHAALQPPREAPAPATPPAAPLARS